MIAAITNTYGRSISTNPTPQQSYHGHYHLVLCEGVLETSP
jgi:hypothetical protein